jgi:steroid delta-isomerase-like uncharacterized protein
MYLKHFVLTSLTASLLAAVPVAHAQGSPDPAAISRDLVTRYASLKNRHDASKMAELYADGYVEHTGRNPSGLAAVTENWKGQFAAIPDLQVSVDDVIASGDKVVARITYTGTHTTPFFGGVPATGKKFTFGTIDIWRVSGGKFSEHWDQVDFAGLQRQLTAKPPAN